MKKRAKGRRSGSNSFFSNSKNAVIALLLIAAAVTAYTLVNAATVSHRPSDITPQGAGSGLDSDLLQGNSGASLMARLLAAGTGSGNLPLQGVIEYSSPSQIITNIPIAMPKVGCTVRITACSAVTPPAKMVVGVNSVARIAKIGIASERDGASRGCIFDSRTGYSGYAVPVERQVGATTWWALSSGSYFVFGTNYFICDASSVRKAAAPYNANIRCDGVVCADNPYNQCYGYTSCTGCTEFHTACNANPVRVDCAKPVCVECPQGLTWDYAAQKCKGQQDCSPAENGEVSIGYSGGVCVYCPTANPNYDPASRSCSTATSPKDTATQGTCSVLTDMLQTGLLDIAFKASGGSTAAPATYVAVAYSCPQD